MNRKAVFETHLSRILSTYLGTSVSKCATGRSAGLLSAAHIERDLVCLFLIATGAFLRVLCFAVGVILQGLWRAMFRSRMNGHCDEGSDEEITCVPGTRLLDYLLELTGNVLWLEIEQDILVAQALRPFVWSKV